MDEETQLELEDELRPEYDLSELLKGGVRGNTVEGRFRSVIDKPLREFGSGRMSEVTIEAPIPESFTAVLKIARK